MANQFKKLTKAELRDRFNGDIVRMCSLRPLYIERGPDFLILRTHKDNSRGFRRSPTDPTIHYKFCKSRGWTSSIKFSEVEIDTDNLKSLEDCVKRANLQVFRNPEDDVEFKKFLTDGLYGDVLNYGGDLHQVAEVRSIKFVMLGDFVFCVHHVQNEKGRYIEFLDHSKHEIKYYLKPENINTSDFLFILNIEDILKDLQQRPPQPGQILNLEGFHTSKEQSYYVFERADLKVRVSVENETRGTVIAGYQKEALRSTSPWEQCSAHYRWTKKGAKVELKLLMEPNSSPSKHLGQQELEKVEMVIKESLARISAYRQSIS